MAAVISNQGGFYSTFAYVSEARRMGVRIRPPDVNYSDIRWKGKAGAIRVGLLSIKHVNTSNQQAYCHCTENRAVWQHNRLSQAGTT